MRRVVNHAEGVHQVVMLHRDRLAQLLRVGLEEADAVFEAEDLGPLARHFQRFLGQVHRGDLGAGAREVDGIGADAAADFQHLLALPPLKIGEPWNMRLHHVLARLDFVEVLARADRLGRVPDVAGARIPVLPDRGNRGLRKGCGRLHGSGKTPIVAERRIR